MLDRTMLRVALAAVIISMMCLGPSAGEDSLRAQAEAWVSKGIAIDNNSDAEAECYRKAIELDPTYPAAHFNLAFVYQSQGKLAEALKAYRACVKHDPARVDAYLNMAKIMSVPGHTQDLQGARAELCRYLELKKDAADASTVKSDILALERKIAELKQAKVKKFCPKPEIEARLSSGFKRGSSPYAGPRLPVRIEFAYDSAKILPESEPQLAELAAAIKGERLNGIAILIEGHADSTGSLAYNEALSRRRAESVKRYLASRFGIPASRFRVEARGEIQPIQPNDTPEHMAANRRVEFVNWNAIEKIRQNIRKHPQRSASEMDQFLK